MSTTAVRHAVVVPGEGGGGYRAALDSEQCWPYILDRYAAAARARGEAER